MYSYSGLWKGQAWISFSYFNTLAEFKNQQPISKVGDHNYSYILEELNTKILGKFMQVEKQCFLKWILEGIK